MDSAIEYPLVRPEELLSEAWAAMARRDSATALASWRTLREHSPERPEAYIWPLQVLWQDGRLDEAEAMAAEAARRFPDHPELAVQQAWIAMSRQHWDAAARRWAKVRETSPERIEGYLWGAHALWRSGRADEAETLAEAAFATRSDDTDLLIERVWIAVARDDWPAAAERLEHARRRAADPARVAESLRWVEQRLATQAAAEGDASTSRALMLAFESLGERCDFGAVQRHFGAEPLGLLRFAWSPLDALIAALDDRFAAVGTPDDTEFSLYGDETIVRMKRYGLIFHTYVCRPADEPEADREAFHRQQRRRLVFLKDKLIADLEAGEKIWVYATSEYADDAAAARLFAALRTYGRNALLHVRPARDDRPAGTVEVLADGLYAGYFPGVVDFVSGGQPPFALWRQLCAQTYRLARPSTANSLL